MSSMLGCHIVRPASGIESARHMEPFEREVVSDLDEHTDDRGEARRRVPLHVRILIGLVAGATLGGAARALLGPDAPAVAWVVRHIAEPRSEERRVGKGGRT